MDLLLIKSLCEKRKGGIRGLAHSVGMTEQNLHRCIRENKIQANDLESISKELNVSVGYFFGEENTVQLRNAGRDYVESGNIVNQLPQSTAKANVPSVNYLMEQNEQLKSQLKDKERIIAFYVDKYGDILS